MTQRDESYIEQLRRLADEIDAARAGAERIHWFGLEQALGEARHDVEQAIEVLENEEAEAR